MATKRARAVAQLADCKPSELTFESYDHCGLDVFSIGNREYAIGSDAQADEAAQAYIESSLWAFNSQWLADSGYLPEGIDAQTVRAIQEARYEDANAPILALVNSTDSLDDLVSDAISEDGRGHFLSSYDGEENEVTQGTSRYYVFRIN